jgi:hypothetical protein
MPPTRRCSSGIRKFQKNNSEEFITKEFYHELRTFGTHTNQRERQQDCEVKVRVFSVVRGKILILLFVVL